MNHKVLLVALLVALALGLSVFVVDAQGPRPGERRAPAILAGTAFTYQGQLKKNGALINGMCDIDFGLWDSDIGGSQLGITQTATSVTISNGLFGGPLNSGGQFGPTAFNGDLRTLQIAVRCPAGSGSYTALSPRQVLNATPYAQYALGNLNRNVSDLSSASIATTGGVLYDFTQSNPSVASSARSVLRLNDNTTTPGANDFLLTARNNATTKFSVKSSGDVEVAGGDLKVSNSGSGIVFPDSSKQTTAASKVLDYNETTAYTVVTTTLKTFATITLDTGTSTLFQYSVSYNIMSCVAAASLYVDLGVDGLQRDLTAIGVNAPISGCNTTTSTMSQFRLITLTPGTHVFQVRASSTVTNSNVAVTGSRIVVISQ